MRIITWNSPGKTIENALEFLKDYDADVITLQECSRPMAEQTGRLWIGHDHKKGIAVIVKPEYQLTAYPLAEEAGAFFCPVTVQGAASFQLLAVWSHRKHKYVEGIIDAVDTYHDFLSLADTLILGDFNSNAIWNKKHGKKNHSELAKRLNERHSLVSVYHEFYNETPGQETKPTFYMRKQKNAPYHIDYCFAPKSWCANIKQVEIGSYEDWIKSSDHCPLVIDFA